MVVQIMSRLILLSTLTALSSPTAAIDNQSEEAAIEVLGVTITRGMSEGEVRAAFGPRLKCSDVPSDVNAPFDSYCSIADGVYPDEDGGVEFKNGYVHMANRAWYVDPGLEPVEVLKVVHDHLVRLTEGNTTCAGIRMISNQDPNYTTYVLPKKYLAVQMHLWPGRKRLLLREGLRAHPVPENFEARADGDYGMGWCAFAR